VRGYTRLQRWERSHLHAGYGIASGPAWKGLRKGTKEKGAMVDFILVSLFFAVTQWIAELFASFFTLAA
jgi:hypothetical protein